MAKYEINDVMKRTILEFLDRVPCTGVMECRMLLGAVQTLSTPLPEEPKKEGPKGKEPEGKEPKEDLKKLEGKEIKED